MRASSLVNFLTKLGNSGMSWMACLEGVTLCCFFCGFSGPKGAGLVEAASWYMTFGSCQQRSSQSSLSIVRVCGSRHGGEEALGLLLKPIQSACLKLMK